jgi:hypothetical protein
VRASRFGVTPTTSLNRCARWVLSEASFYSVYLGEFLGTDPRAYVVRSTHPCEPSAINWLD